jgi:hypothetical protein
MINYGWIREVLGAERIVHGYVEDGSHLCRVHVVWRGGAKTLTQLFARVALRQAVDPTVLVLCSLQRAIEGG